MPTWARATVHTGTRLLEILVSLEWWSAPISYEAPISSLELCPSVPTPVAGGTINHPQPPKGKTSATGASKSPLSLLSSL